MLRKTAREDGLQTVTLARGTLKGNLGRAMSSHARSESESPNALRIQPSEMSVEPESASLLSQVGIIEFLEQDERPTFIVDLQDQSNYTPNSSPMTITWTNLSLKVCPGLIERVTGKNDASFQGIAGHLSFQQFKNWCLSAVLNGQSLDACLPCFMHAGLLWTCLTLRKRIRRISGTLSNTQPVISTGSTYYTCDAHAFKSTVDPALANSAPLSSMIQPNQSSPLAKPEPQEYFPCVTTFSAETAAGESVRAPPDVCASH